MKDEIQPTGGLNPVSTSAIKPNPKRDGVIMRMGLAADFIHLRQHPSSTAYHKVLTASGEHWAHSSEMKWD